jgi:superfamily II DNA or RNA helicase
MKRLPVLLEDRLYVPKELVRQQHLDAYTHVIKHESYKPLNDGRVEKKCRNCHWWRRPWKDEKQYTQYCHKIGYTEVDSCSDFQAKQIKVVEEIEIHTYKRRKNNYVAFARGDLEKLQKTFGHLDIKDNRSARSMGVDLKFGHCPDGKRIKLFPEQKALVKQWLKAGGGILKSPTGSGKSTMLSAILDKLGLRALILAPEVRHLTTILSELRQHTNLLELEKVHGKGQVCGFYTNHGKDKGKAFPITLATFQIFSSKKGRKRLKKLKNKFGLVWVEEADQGAAPTFHHVSSTFNPMWRGGSTATPKRKDKMHCVVFDAIGPVVAEGNIKVLPCEVEWVNTRIEVPEKVLWGQYKWSRLLDFLGRSKTLYDTVLENVIADIRHGRKPLVISERRAFAIRMAQDIKASGYNAKLLMGGEGKSNRDDTRDPWKPIVDKLDRGSLHAVIGTKVLNKAVNIPPLDTLHLPFPSANEEMEEQRAGRIRRKHPDKQFPRIYVYCFQGADIAVNGNRTRERVFERLGFEECDRSRQTRINDVKKQASEGKAKRKML